MPANPATPANPKTRVPSYRRHKATGQAVVTIDGRDFYLGKHGTKQSQLEYNRLIAEHLAGGGPAKPAADYTVNELLAAFLKHARAYYVRPDGTETGEVEGLKMAMRPLRPLYGHTPVTEFGPLSLRAVREEMIRLDWSRGVINQGINRIRRIFKWGTEHELVPPAVLHGLQAVSGLRRGRTDARETEPVKPVPEAHVDAVLPFVAPAVAAMIQLQRLTGMRSGEVTIMRPCDIDTSGPVWVFVPHDHKTQHHGHARNAYLGPQAQAILKPYLLRATDEYCFSPAEAESERHAQRLGVIGEGRKTPVYPSELRARERRKQQRDKRRGKRVQTLGHRYVTDSYRRAIDRGIEQANRQILAEAAAEGIDSDEAATIPHWHPHQLRHNAATQLRKEHGIEVARIILGHRSAAITEVYAEVDHARAIDVMGRVG